MVYENQVLVFPIGMKANANPNRIPFYKLKIKNSYIKGGNFRRDTLKIGNATRLRKITEDTIIDNCVIYLEGTLTNDSVVPFDKFYVNYDVPMYLKKQFYKN